MLPPICFNPDLLHGSKYTQNKNQWIKPYEEVLAELRDRNYLTILVGHLSAFYERKSS